MHVNAGMIALQHRAGSKKAKTEADEALSRNGLISAIELKRSQLDLSQLRKTGEIEARLVAYTPRSQIAMSSSGVSCAAECHSQSGSASQSPVSHGGPNSRP